MSDYPYEPKNLPVNLRAFLGAITVWPMVFHAARVTAEAMHPQVEPLAPPVTRGRGPSQEDRIALEALQEARERERRKLIERTARHIREHHYRRMKSGDVAYAAAFETAYEMGKAGLQDWAIERATLGWQEPVYQGGMLVGFKHKVSDRNLIRALETLYQDTWGKRKVEHSGGVQLGIASMTDEELERIARGGLDGAAAAAPDV